jgi:hypothetical protein
MSSSFATMTSSLLVRKGDAGPSVVALPLRQPRAAAMAAAPEPATFSHRIAPPRQGAEGGRADASQKLHRIRVALTTGDLQRIGIAAVKAGVSRQAIIHAALRTYLTQLAEDLHHTCNCLAGEPCACTAMDSEQAGRPVATAETRLDRAAGGSTADY